MCKCYKLQILLKSQNKLAKAFHFKDCIPKELTSTVVYKFHCRLCNESHYVECLRQLNGRIGEYIGIIRKLSLRVMVLAIICYFVTIHHLLNVLAC